MDERLDALINGLKEEYDYVVLDTPPVSLVTDAFLLDRFVTNSILVIHAGKTKRAELEYLSDLCKEGKLTKPSIVLNGVKPPKRYGYYYYK
jgi:Mrp family chromosome partitioning ATPase